MTAIQNGSGYIESGNDELAAKAWLQGWDTARAIAQENGYQSIDQLEAIAVGKPLAFMSNWILDLESCLGNLAMHSTFWAKQRAVFVREFCRVMPKSPADILFTFRHAEAESLFLLGKLSEGEELFEQLCADYSTEAWAYIGWGDMYSPKFYGTRWPSNPEKAREIYERGLASCTEDKDALTQRLSLL